MVDGVLYMLTSLNQVAALDAASGEELWTHDPQVYLSGPSISPLGFHHRGVAWWSDGEDSRVIVSTNDGYVFSLIAETGEVDTTFAGGRIEHDRGHTQGGTRPVGLARRPAPRRPCRRRWWWAMS